MSRTPPPTIAELLRKRQTGWTAADRKLAHALLADYPVAGLGSITDLARIAGVSSPSVLRFAKKLGFTGMPAFQSALRREVSAQLQNPIAREDRWAAQAPRTHVLNSFADAALDNLRASLKLMDHKVFDALVRLLADQKRRIHLLGGRITGHVAGYFHTHLTMARPGVFLVPPDGRHWPQQLLDFSAGDVLVVFDVRRYDARVHDFAASARQRGAKIVLITDQWMSPIARIAAYTLPLRVEVPKSWDSNMVTVFAVEALVAGVVNQNWTSTQARIREIDTYYEGSRRGR